MLSNSDPRQKNPENTFFDDLYAGFHIQRLSIFRSVCSIAEKRETVNELLIRNAGQNEETDKGLRNASNGLGTTGTRHRPDFHK